MVQRRKNAQARQSQENSQGLRVRTPPKRRLQKQVSYWFDLADHQLLRNEAIRRGISIAEMVRQWTEPQLEKLRKEAAQDADAAS